MHRIDWSDDRGFAGGSEVLPFGFLVFVIGALMVTNLWAVIDTKMALDGASREGARLVAESDGDPSPSKPSQLGKEAADASLSAYKKDPTKMTYAVTYSGSGGWQTCARATVTVTYQLGLINLPIIGMIFPTGGTTVSSTHSEIVDPYRSRDTAIAATC